MCTHIEIFGFEVNHEYIIQFVEAVELNIYTFKVHIDIFSVFQTVWGILYTGDSPEYHILPSGKLNKREESGDRILRLVSKTNGFTNTTSCFKDLLTLFFLSVLQALVTKTVGTLKFPLSSTSLLKA